MPQKPPAAGRVAVWLAAWAAFCALAIVGLGVFFEIARIQLSSNTAVVVVFGMLFLALTFSILVIALIVLGLSALVRRIRRSRRTHDGQEAG